MAARRIASATTFAPSSGAGNPARPPWNFPMGVRTPDRMTGVSVFMADLRRSSSRGATNSSIARCQAGRFRAKLGRSMLRPYKKKCELVCASGVGLHFVGAGAVEARHRDIQQPEVHGELRTVMIMVVQHHPANCSDTRHFENFLPSSKQPPVLHHFGVADALQRGFSICDVLV